MPTHSVIETTLRRLDELIQEGADVRKYDSYSVETAPMVAWRTRTLAFLQRILGPADTYTQTFAQKTDDDYHGSRDTGVAILANLRSDIESGYLQNYYLGIAGEVLADLLDLAAWSLTEGSKEAAAILASSGLELGLRRVANAREIDISKARGIEDINDALTKTAVYGPVRRSQVDAWRILRNHAIHGEHEAYSDADVRLMLEGVRAFLAEELQ